MSTPTGPHRLRVGFVGLGRMGSAMAAQLVQAGHDVTVWSRNARHVDHLVEQGARRGAGPEDAVQTGLLMSMLANEDVVRTLITPEVLAAAPAGFVHVNHATISGPAAEEFAALAGSVGHGYVSAPVLGRPNVAAQGQLTILASGAAEHVAAVEPVLSVVGRRVWNYGPEPSAACLAKIATNYLIVHALGALTESLVLLERHRLDLHQFLAMIADSVFPGPVYGGYGAQIADRAYSPAQFTSVNGSKDVQLAVRAAADAGVHLPSGPVLQELFQACVDEVGPDVDWSAIAEIVRRRSAPQRVR